jgi:4-amino-4-deoxy-L-arabinose transferase-like glycosyltransferase
MSTDRSNANLRLFIFLAILVNFSGLFVNLMDPDAGVYASISRNMVLNKDWVNLIFQDKDWLDKPHFPFWITAIFFKVFGMHEWSYKLPGIFFVILAARYTFIFARKYYSEKIALWSTFILLSSLHILISNNDVRAEPYLTGMIIASVYHFARSLEKKLSWHLVWGALFAGMAMMTKGLFTLAPIGAAIGGHLLITRQWKQIFHFRWVLAGVLLVIFISPELYALWLQFDQHPEKIFFGRDHVSGIKFFLWDSQFGRFMNTGPIKGKGDPFFFLHTLLWAFLPWCFLMVSAFYDRFKTFFSSRGEWYTVFGALFTLLIFSFSKFQLPYYTNIIFPFLAILTAVQVDKFITNNNRLWPRIQHIISSVLLVLIAAIWIFYRPSLQVVPLLLFIIALAAFIYYSQQASANERPWLRSGLSVLLVALFINLVFYPDLLKYQSGNQAAFYINKNFPGTPVGRMSFYMPSGEFYLKQHIQPLDSASIHQFPKGGLIFLSSEDKESLDKQAIAYDQIREFPEYHITMLKLKFLDPSKRESTLKKYYLIRLR